MNWYTNTRQVYSRYDVDTQTSYKPPVMCDVKLDETDEIWTQMLILLGTKKEVLREGNAWEQNKTWFIVILVNYVVN